ncbi:MAG TPA: amino acid permease, partial [Gemmataceae bacterium]|nr:amino acid permease [Gemmataceae bacterium]
PKRFTPQEETVWVRDTSQPDRLKPKLDDNGNPIPRENEAVKEIANVTGLDVHKPEDPLGFLGNFRAFGFLRAVGLLGLFLAFGHSILAMSGEETLAQVYREVEAPKMRNFKRAAFIVFIYSLVLTAGVSFLAVLIIPDEVRMKFYSGNLISGLARHVVGPPVLKLGLETFVVVVGFLILAGAVNTAIIGSNGVLNRIAEDGVLPDWFLKPHPRYGTTSRLLKLIAGMQIGVILLSMGHIIVLGEAYAFGVVWSFVFKALSMIVLRYKDKTPREYRVPLNLRIGGVEIPIGLCLIFFTLLMAAVLNFFTKEVATVSGIIFTIAFLTIFVLSERFHEKRLRGAKHEHLEQFNERLMQQVSVENLDLHREYRKLVAIRSTQNLFMLEKALAETDPETTDVVVMTAKVTPTDDAGTTGVALDPYDQHLMTALVERAERAGKHVQPLIVPTNNPLHAILRTAMELKAQEVIMGASNKFATDMQLEEIEFQWLTLHGGEVPPLTVRILSRDRDVYLDIAGGNRIPKLSERKARSVEELRAAGVGVNRVLMYHDGTTLGSDLFRLVLTTLDPQVALVVARASANGAEQPLPALRHDLERAEQLHREVNLRSIKPQVGTELARLAKDERFDLVIVAAPNRLQDNADEQEKQIDILLKLARSPVMLIKMPEVPQEAAAD